MKIIKIIILLKIVFVSSLIANPIIDSLKDERSIYFSGDFNEDCYEDTLFCKIENGILNFPDLIVWGVQDSSINCDTNRVYIFDSSIVPYTLIDSTNYSSLIINFITSDINLDGVFDFLINKHNSDTTNIDSIQTLVIFGNNKLSKDTFLKIDSLVLDSVDFRFIDIDNYTKSIGNYGKYKFEIVEEIPLLNQSSKESNQNIVQSNVDFYASIFPNPSNGILNVTTTAFPFDIAVVDVNGKVVLSLENISNRRVSLDLTKHPSGTYIIKINKEKIELIQKFIKYE